MIKGPKDIAILILAAMCLVVSLVFMPWSELNFTGNFPDWLSGIMDYFGINHRFAELAKNKTLMEIVTVKDAQTNVGDYAYSLFLFVAMSAAAIAIVLIGKEDNSEKTVLQAKK